MSKKANRSYEVPRLCFVGPMIGRHPGHVTMQGQILSDLFKESGYPVISVSSVLNRYVRLADIVSTLIRLRHWIDIVIVEVYGGPSFVVEDIASWLGRRLNKRVVMWLHGGAMPEFMARFPKWTRRVLGRADVLVAPSTFLARSVALYGFQAEVISNVIDMSAYEYRHRETVSPRMFWMRSFHPIWNPEMAIRVLKRLQTTVSDATLVMAGPDGGTEGEAQQLAQNLGLNGSVRFAGFLDMTGKKREGEAADIFINTNRIDNMPVAIVEACAMGLPVVTTDVGGIRDLLTNGETGLLVPSDDDEAMVDAIRTLLDNPDLAGRLSANGRRLAERASWKHVRPQWENVFTRLMIDSNRAGNF